MTVSVLRATLNFAKATRHENIWSNFNADRVNQQFDRHEVEIRNARQIAPPDIRREGFTLISAPLGETRWQDAEWVTNVHIPASIDIVRSLTGSAFVFLYCPVLIRMAGESDGSINAAPPARFVHIDQTPESTEELARIASGGLQARNFSSVSIFNVWRSFSDAPQNTPLAVCDIRTVRRELLKTGRTVSDVYPDGIPYLSPLFCESYRWSYFPDMSPDEAIVFKGVDITGGSMGCMHSAFDLPIPIPGAPARSSIETRILAFKN